MSVYSNSTFSRLLQGYELVNEWNIENLKGAEGLYQDVLADADPQPNKVEHLVQRLVNAGVTDDDVDACCEWAKDEISTRLSSHKTYTYTYYVEGLVNALVEKKAMEKLFSTVTFNPEAQVHETPNYQPQRNWYVVERV